MGSSIALAAVVAALAIQSIPSGPPPLFEPVDQWTVDYAENMCVVSRQFRSGERKVTLGFRPLVMSDNFRVALFVPDSGKDVTRGTTKLGFDSLPPVEAPFVKGPIKIEATHLIGVDATRKKVGALGSAKTLQVTTDTVNLRLKLGNIGGALKALDACEKDLLIDWGMDPKVLASIKTLAFHPRGLPSVFFTDDYPQEALRKNEQGASIVRFRIGKNGRTSECKVVQSSGSSALDAQTCNVIRIRAKFEPARDAAGQPVETIGVQRINWEIPK